MEDGFFGIPHNGTNKTYCPWGDPHDLKAKYFNPDGDVAAKVPHLMVVLAAVYVSLGGVGALLLRDPTKAELDAIARRNNGRLSSGKKSESAPLINTASTINNNQSLLESATFAETAVVDATPLDVLKSGQGWLLWALFIMTASGGVFVIGSYKTYAEGLKWGQDDKVTPRPHFGLSFFFLLHFVSIYLC